MENNKHSQNRNNLIGSAWMVAAMAAFAIEDAFIKVASVHWPVWQVLVLFGAGGALVFACLAKAKGKPLFIPDILSRPMIVRVFFEVLGRLFYVLALALTPLSSATVILQATPLVVVVGAVLFFGERVGWRRWFAIFLGLVGVVVIIQPGAASFSVLSLLAVIGMIGFAGRDLASRAAPATVDTHLLGLYGFLAIVVAGILYAFIERAPMVMPSLSASAFLIAAIVFGVGAYSCLMNAMRTGDVSAVTPFRYTRLLFGVALGLVFFGEAITVPMMVGSLLIVMSGLFILWRGKTAKTHDTK